MDDSKKEIKSDLFERLEILTPRVLIFASRSERAYLLINYLAARLPVAGVVFEAPHTGRMLRHRLKKLGAWAVAGQLAFLIYDRLVIRPRSRPRIARLLAGRDVRPPDGRLPVWEVDTINGPETSQLLAELRPAAVVVSGTGIITRRVLALAPAFINVHVGITPRYRGVHGGFWAVAEGRPDLAGVTLHLVDPGVDTGSILAQAAITVAPDDTFRTLPVKQYLAALEPLAAQVETALAGRLAPYTRDDDLPSRQWYSPAPGDYVRFVRQLRRLGR